MCRVNRKVGYSIRCKRSGFSFSSSSPVVKSVLQGKTSDFSVAWKPLAELCEVEIIPVTFPGNVLKQVTDGADFNQRLADGFGISIAAITAHWRSGQNGNQLMVALVANSTETQAAIETAVAARAGFVHNGTTFLSRTPEDVGVPLPPDAPPAVVTVVVRSKDYEIIAGAAGYGATLTFSDRNNNTNPGWTYADTLDGQRNSKLYLPGYIVGQLEVSLEFRNIVNLWYRVTYYPVNQALGAKLPFFNLYTMKTTGEMYKGRYESRYTWIDQQSRIDPRLGGTDFVISTSGIPPHLKDAAVTHGSLRLTFNDTAKCGDVRNIPSKRCCGGSTCGPRDSAEMVMSLNLSTNSAASGNDYRFVVKEIGMTSDDGITYCQNYNPEP